MLYVDDGAFAFETRKDTETVSNLVLKYFNRSGLQMHIGSKSNTSKTECDFFPDPGHLKPTKPTSTSLPTDFYPYLPITLKHKKENNGTRQKIHDQKYDNAKETKPILVGESGMIKFTRHFKYLGS